MSITSKIIGNKNKNLNFSEALNKIKDGHKLSRTGWNGKNMFVKLQSPTDKSKMTQSYIYLETEDGQLVPWIASQSDLLAEDWFVVQ